jgi:nicotinate-nucleotide pyrophosphorylase (carboxylating)
MTSRIPAWLAAHVRASLAEDHAAEDITSALSVDPATPGEAVICAGARGTLAGTQAAAAVFRILSARLRVRVLARDGARLRKGEAVLRASGPKRLLLAGERTALNYLMRLSGVATLTAEYVAALRGTGVRLLDTRKTTPHLRALEKQAVLAGGGCNHRMGLHDAVLIKENHVRAAGSVGAAVSRAQAGLRRRRLRLPIEIEVQSQAEVREVKELPVQRVMLDNFTPAGVRRAVACLKTGRHAPEIEVSGGVTLATIRRYALPGVDFISVGALTHSAVALPFSLDWIR